MSAASKDNPYETLTQKLMGAGYAKAPLGALYHFTGANSLHGIVQSRTFHCSHVAYCNDGAELRQLLHDFRRALKGLIYPSDMANGEPLMSRIMNILEGFIVQAEPIFIACFSNTDPALDLSQWRAYAPQGYCVELKRPVEECFDFRGLHWQLGPCRYGNEHLTVHSLIEHLGGEDELRKRFATLGPKVTIKSDSGDFDLGDKRGASMINQALSEVLEPLRSPLLAVAPFCKSRTFESENEWRLVLRPYKLPYHDTKARVGRTTLIPYVELPFTSDRLPIDVWIGPALDQELAQRALHLLGVGARKASMSFRSTV